MDDPWTLSKECNDKNNIGAGKRRDEERQNLPLVVEGSSTSGVRASLQSHTVCFCYFLQTNITAKLLILTLCVFSDYHHQLDYHQR